MPREILTGADVADNLQAKSTRDDAVVSDAEEAGKAVSQSGEWVRGQVRKAASAGFEGQDLVELDQTLRGYKPGSSNS